MPPTEKMTPIASVRFVQKTPRGVRASLPPADTFEGGVVYLANVGHRLDDRGGSLAAATLPELTIYYAQGWKFAYAEPVHSGDGQDVYLWRPLTSEVAV